MYKHILIPTGGSILSATAVENGMHFARDAGAKVTVVTIVEPFHVLTTDPKQLAETPLDYEARQGGGRTVSHRSGAPGRTGGHQEGESVFHVGPRRRLRALRRCSRPSSP